MALRGRHRRSSSLHIGRSSAPLDRKRARLDSISGATGTARMIAIISTTPPPSGRAGVDVVAEPELEDEQGPELVGVVPAPLDVLVDQGRHGVGAEQAPADRDGVEQDRAELVLELVAEPAVDGDAEAHFGAVADRRGEVL